MDSAGIRNQWVGLLVKVASAPLEALANGALRATMPVEYVAGSKEGGEALQRRHFSHLEAFGRTLAGIAPWLELWHSAGSASAADAAEAQQAAHFTALVHRGLGHALDPHSADALNFTQGTQPLVDAAFLAHGLLRAPNVLWQTLPQPLQTGLADALRSTRCITPHASNWLLFSAMVEAALLRFTGEADLTRIDYAVRQHEQWYKGDGAYGDGAEFHWDFYNSFVIQPMLLDVLETLAACNAPTFDRYAALLPKVKTRALRYAQVQERMVGADGSFPPLGRSLAYRCGAFQLLAQIALREELPQGLEPAQVRGALGAVICRTLEAPNTFDAGGWLRIGLCGHQPGLAERYISTGSLYLCSTAFLPLGLDCSAAFWVAPPVPWSQCRIWGGEDAPADAALKGI